MNNFDEKTADSDSPLLFSIIIPTWNNLNMLKLCLQSIRKNSRYQHQIILHINEGKDNTRAWVEEQNLLFSFSDTNVGVCAALNSAASLAQTDYILYLNDDMYVCPDWDFHLWEEIQQQPDHLFFISSTAIEPHDVRKKTAIAPYNFGTDVNSFKEEELLNVYSKLPTNDWSGSSWPPCVVHRSVWDKVEGYSLEFFPGFYSDPDFSMKLWQIGVRRFKGVAASRVYHFLESTTKKLKRDSVKEGRKLFLKKWGITAKVFYTHYLRMGQTYKGTLPEPSGLNYYLDFILCKFKK